MSQEEYTPLLHPQPSFADRPSNGNGHGHGNGSHAFPKDVPKAQTLLQKVFYVLRPGFTKQYNIWLFSLSSAMMVLFTLPRLKYLLPSLLPSVLSPGDWYYFHEGIPFVALMIHLACVLPLSLLMILQFTPRIRQGHLLLHRINGYICIVLSLVGNLTALILARRAFGGNIASQTVTGLLAIMSTTGLAMAWWNIRRLQIEQHRAWMLRSMYWMGSIVSTRFIMPFAALVQTYMGGYYEAWSCAEIEFTLGGRNKTLDLYPQCGLLNGTTDGWVAVKGELDFGKPIGVGAVFDSNFGMGLWLALFLHVVGVEIYLALTPVEAERLRRISYKKQVEAGYKDPGNWGTTVQKWGDALEWDNS